jgi:hypothetical protein
MESDLTGWVHRHCRAFFLRPPRFARFPGRDGSAPRRLPAPRGVNPDKEGKNGTDVKTVAIRQIVKMAGDIALTGFPARV